MKKLRLLIVFSAVFISSSLYGQDFIENSRVSVNFQADAQLYLKDKGLGITDSTLAGKQFGLNGFAEVKYTYKNFTAGLRFEGYYPPLNGFSNNYTGYGIPYYFVNYKNKFIDVTAGSFYEQFGSGMVLRAYQDWLLGYDNSINGFRVKFTPFRGIYLKGLIGIQRNYWIKPKDDQRGTVRGLDLELNISDIVGRNWGTNFAIGGSFVSKYQSDPGEYSENFSPVPGVDGEFKLNIPKNVAAWAARFNVDYKGFAWMSEYAYKFSDPAAYTNPQPYIYHPGQGFYTAVSYSTSGFGAVVQLKRIDNMKWKSRTQEAGGPYNQIDINYIPAIAPLYQYSLQNMYPNASQPDGEAGIFAQVTYNFRKKSALGGKYGTNLTVNYTRINSIPRNPVDANTGNNVTNVIEDVALGYNSPFFSVGKDLYYQDAYIQIDKKCTKDFKFTLAYLYEQYNAAVMEGGHGLWDIHVATLDMTYKINNFNALRLEIQALFTGTDPDPKSRFTGNWLAGTLEWSLAPNWFVSIQDEWNYGNPVQKTHYVMGAVAYTTGATRVALSYGRQREGLLCVGGVCRYVPSASGFTLSVTSSF